MDAALSSEMKNSDANPPIPQAVDVAFSLLAQDQGIAEQLSDRLREKLRVFLWTEAQKDMAGKNGVALLNELYERRAQLVVVLYRKGYAETRFTRLEESAITSKGLNDGWSRVFLISLDGTKPSWIPASRLWFGLDTFGLDVAAETIEARFAELGVQARPETIVERATRIETEKKGQERAVWFRRTQEGVDTVQAEVKRFAEYLKQRATDINAVASSLNVQYQLSARDPNLHQLAADKARTTFGWWTRYSNSLSEASLFIREFAVRLSTKRFIDNSDPINEVAYLPFLDWRDEKVVWRERVGSRASDETTGRAFTTEQLADHFIERLLQNSGGVQVD